MSLYTSREISPEAGKSADVEPENDGGLAGEFATAPWMGLHYRIEGP